MLTRIEVDGFKNLVDFSLDFGPYTCLAGENGAGKSNIFDAIRFLALLTDHTIIQSALQIRSSEEGTGEIGELFFAANGETRDRITLAAEMIVGKRVVDDFGRPGVPSSTFLRYEVAFRREHPSASSGLLGGLVLEHEDLRHIPMKHAPGRLQFPHNRQGFRNRAIYNNRRGSGYISTRIGISEPATIVIHQDGGSSGRARPAAPAERAPRTAVGTENTAATPTILAARREMQSWRILALEPAAMRRPDKYTDEPGIGADGGHIPVTLYHLAKHTGLSDTLDDPDDDLLSRIASRLSGLVPVKSVRAVRDDVRQLFSLELEEPSGTRLRANSISDGTLRFLALTAIAEATGAGGVYCMEEPENGIHPEKLTAMNQLLHDIAVDPDEPVAADNPLRQVIVATHSPYFVQLQNADDVVLAKNPALRALAGKVIRPLRCYPLQHTWRDRKNQEEQDGRARGVGKIELQAYLIPPEDGQISFPDRVPTPEVKVVEKDRATPRPRGKNWRAYFDKDTRGSLPARQEPALEEQDQLRGSASLTSERMAGSRWRRREKHV